VGSKNDVELVAFKDDLRWNSETSILTKDSSLLLHAITVSSTGGFKEN
jgi:hypothetical protein